MSAAFPLRGITTWLGHVVVLGAAVAASGAAAQHTPRPDTSQWKCEKCPQPEGYRATYELGVTHVSEGAARFGNGTGYDKEGGYLAAGGYGTYTKNDSRAEWVLSELGTDARSIDFTGGQPGVYRYELSYDELPYRRFDSTETIYRTQGDERLMLPADWAPAEITSGFAALDATLRNRDIEIDRTTYRIGGRYRGFDNVRLAASYRRTDRDGWNIIGASFYNSAALLAVPLDDRTETVDVSASYRRDRWFVDLSWSGSFYSNSHRRWRFDNPYSGALAGGAAQGEVAQPPDSDAHTLSLSGAYELPWRTTVSLTGAIGRMKQDERLLAYSINPAVPAVPLPRNSLDAKVETTHFQARVTSRPWSFLSLRAAYRYDDRDNETPVELWSRTIADVFPGGDELNRPYSFRRLRWETSAALKPGEWISWLKPFELEGGYEHTEADRTLQEITDQSENSAWGRVRWRVFGADVSVRAGASRREADGYNTQLGSTVYGQNPLLRKYSLAYRFRDFVELQSTYGLTKLPITVSAEAYYATDDFTRSLIGLKKADDRRFAADVTWSINEDVTAYLQAGYEDIELRTVGSEAFASPDWRSTHSDLFRSIGVGLDWDNLTDRLDVQLNLTYARGTGNVSVDSRFSGSSGFPRLQTNLKSATADVSYRLSETLGVSFRIRYEDFETSDWALENVEPATLPQVLTLGADPYAHSVFSGGFRVFGHF